VIGAHPPLFTISTITYKVVVYAPAERAICTLWSYDLAPPPPPPPSPINKLSLFLSLPVCRLWSVLTERGRRGWATARKPGPLKSFNTLCHIGKSYKDDLKASYFASLSIRHSNHWFGQIRQKQFLFLAEVSFRGSCFGFPLTCPIFQNPFGQTNLFKQKDPKKMG
jgi:hypothetical protein